MNKRFLGTPRIWWLATGVLLLLGLILIATGMGNTLGNVGGVLMVIAAIFLFAAAPMRYGDAANRQRSRATTAAPAPPPPPAPTPAPPTPPARPRPKIEGGDPSQV